MQFSIMAYDYEDDDAINRRLAQRQAHIDGIESMVKQGRFLSGGAILNDDGKMIGSSVHVEFPNRDEMEQWISQDPYVTGKVWEKIEINEIKLVPVADMLSR